VIALVTAGGLQPLLDAVAPGPSRTAWGYVLLALAAGWVLEFQSNLLRLERERSNGAATRPGSVPLPSAAEP
jgi:hypothetical protein